ncbi:hypothetical protein B0H14DRAFT_3147030 [Mycena olivaceomarginata]|nr:hypothetical protein B0H14DRAFT_3147030 [Mycena olivaceomarginata]
MHHGVKLRPLIPKIVSQMKPEPFQIERTFEDKPPVNFRGPLGISEKAGQEFDRRSLGQKKRRHREKENRKRVRVKGSDLFPSETGQRTVETVSVPSVEGISLPGLKTGRNGLVNTPLSVITGPHSGVPEDSRHQTSHPPRGIMDLSKTGRRTGTGQTDLSVFQIFCPKNGRFFDGCSVLRTVRSPTPARTCKTNPRVAANKKPRQCLISSANFAEEGRGSGTTT